MSATTKTPLRVLFNLSSTTVRGAPDKHPLQIKFDVMETWLS